MNDVLKRTTYPQPASLGRDARFLVRLAIASAMRRVAHALRSPGPAVVSALGLLALFLLMLRRPVTAAAGGSHAWVLPLLAGFLLIVGVRAWWQHLAKKLEESTWVALGGRPSVLALGLLVTQTMFFAIALAWGVRATGSANPLSALLGWWASTTVAWLAICLLAGALLRRANARPRWVSDGRVAIATSALVIAAALMWILATNGSDPATIAIAALALVVIVTPLLVPVFLGHERIRLGFEDRLARTPGEAAAAISRPVTFIGLRKMGALLVLRTMASELAQVVALSGLVGLVAAGARTIEGPARASFLIAGFVVVVTLGLALRLRTVVGAQHLFLFLHRPSSRSPVWRHLAQGECLVFVLAIGAAFLLLTVPTRALRVDDSWPFLFALTLEWAAYVGLAAHTFSPGSKGDEGVRALLVPAAAAAALFVVLVKAVVLGNVIGRWFVPLQAAACAAAIVSWGARAPYYVNGARALRTGAPPGARS